MSPWRWFDNGQTLVEDVGPRKIMLTVCDERLATRGLDGILIPLTADHAVAKLIESAPSLLEALEEVSNVLTVEEIQNPGKGWGDFLAKHVTPALKKAKP